MTIIVPLGIGGNICLQRGPVILRDSLLVSAYGGIEVDARVLDALGKEIEATPKACCRQGYIGRAAAWYFMPAAPAAPIVGINLDAFIINPFPEEVEPITKDCC